MDVQRDTYCPIAMARAMAGEEDLFGVVDRALTLYPPQGGLYVFRPAIPAAPDFTLAAGDFTTDGLWHELDLSGITPAGICCAYCFITVEDNLPSDLELRRPGGVGVEGVVHAITAGRANSLAVFVNAGGNSAIEYRASNTVWGLIELTVIGWFALPQ